MEEIRRVLEETAEDVDRKLEEIERSKEEHVGSVKEYVGDRDEDLLVSISGEDLLGVSSSSEEDQVGDGKRKEDEDETDEDDDETEVEDGTEEWDETDPVQYHLPRSLCTAGVGCNLEIAETVAELVEERYFRMCESWANMLDDNRTHVPAKPMRILPKITKECICGALCYHREYWTDTTSETEPSHPYFEPCDMMQVFSLKLSSTLAHSVDIYGTFAVRDCWEPRRNYLFKRSRNDPATIAPGCSFLPLCSPCRGIFVFQYFLLDIDLWIKEEGGVFPDMPLFSGYIISDAQWSGFGCLLKGRIQEGPLGLDMHYAFLYDSIETVIEVLAAAEYPSDVKISALTSGFDDEIAIYDGTFCGTGVIARHFIAVRKLEKLHVFVKLDDSIYKWTFLAGVGVLGAPDGPVSGVTQFEVNVSFRTKGKASSAWQWRGTRNETHQQQII